MICSEVYDSHATLEGLEQEGKELSQGYRSRETAALKTKLTNTRRHWEALCSRAKEQSASLSSNVSHWHMYQNRLHQLQPWMDNAEACLAADIPQTGSIQEAKELLDQHMVILHLTN